MGGLQLNGIQKTLGDMLQRALAPEKPLREIGFLMTQEMKTNISRGGRPKAWPKSIRVQKRGGQTLRDSGTLMNSMTSEVSGNSVSAGPTAVGRKKLRDPRIMAILAYGGTIQHHSRSETFLRNRVARGKNKGRFKRGTTSGRGQTIGSYTTTIPARDYTYIPDATQVTFGEIVQNYLQAR